MKGQHVNFTAIKINRRRKILCIVVAIALIGLMLPHGVLAQVRAFAEQNAQSAETTEVTVETLQNNEDTATDSSEEVASTTTEETTPTEAPAVDTSTSEAPKYHESVNGITVQAPTNRSIPNGIPNEALSATFEIADPTTYPDAGMEMYSYDYWDYYGDSEIDIVSKEKITDPTFSEAYFNEDAYYYVDADTNILVLIYGTYQGEYRVVQVLPYEFGSAKFVKWTLNDIDLVPDEFYDFSSSVSTYTFKAVYEAAEGYAAKLQLFSDEEGVNISIRDQSSLPEGWNWSSDGLWVSKMFAEETAYNDIYADFLGEGNAYALHWPGHEFKGWIPQSAETTLVADTAFYYNFEEHADITVKAYAGEGEFTGYQYYEEWQLVDDHYEASFKYDSTTMEDVIDSWSVDFPHKAGYTFKDWTLTPEVEGYLIDDVTMTATYEIAQTYKVEFAAEVITNGVLNNPSCVGGYVEGADSYYVVENSEYFHDSFYGYITYPETYVLYDNGTDLYRYVEAVANDGYEFDSWEITPAGSDEEGYVTQDMKFTAKFKNLGSAVATFDFTEDETIVVDATKATEAGWEKDSAANKWSKVIPLGTATVQAIEEEWSDYVTYSDGSIYAWNHNNETYSYDSTIDTDTTWVPHKITNDDYQFSVTADDEYGFNASLYDLDPDFNIAWYQFFGADFSEATTYNDTYFSKYPLNLKSSLGMIGYQIIDNDLVYAYVNERDTNTWYYGLVVPNLDGADNAYVQWSLNGEPITTSNFNYFTTKTKNYHFSYDVQESVNVRGQITDAITAEPLYYEYVYFVAGDDPTADPLLRVETSEYGLYNFNIPKGTSGYIKADIRGYGTEVVKVTGTSDEVHDISLYPDIELSGRVVGVDGSQLQGVKAVIYDSDTNLPVSDEIYTNQYGYYRFSDLVLKDTKYFDEDGCPTNIYVKVEYKPFTSMAAFTGTYTGEFPYGGDAAYKAGDITLEPGLSPSEWSVSALDAADHYTFYIYGTYNGVTYEGAKFNTWNQNWLYQGTKVGVIRGNIHDGRTFGLHLEYEYEGAPSEHHYDLYIYAKSSVEDHTPYAWRLNGDWVTDYIDPGFVLNFNDLDPASDAVKFTMEYKQTITSTINGEGIEGHDHFHTQYYINDPEHLYPPTAEWDSASVKDELYVGTEISITEEGFVHLDYVDPSLNYANEDEDVYDECGIVVPIPAEGYQIARWTLNGATFNPGELYIVGSDATIDLVPVYEPIPAQIDASAQTGDSTSTLWVFAVLVMAGATYIATRKKLN